MIKTYKRENEMQKKSSEVCGLTAVHRRFGCRLKHPRCML